MEFKKDEQDTDLIIKALKRVIERDEEESNRPLSVMIGDIKYYNKEKWLSNISTYCHLPKESILKVMPKNEKLQYKTYITYNNESYVNARACDVLESAIKSAKLISFTTKQAILDEMLAEFEACLDIVLAENIVEAEKIEVKKY